MQQLHDPREKESELIARGNAPATIEPLLATAMPSQSQLGDL